MLFEDFAGFIAARDTARQNKEAGLPRPWTDDPIIQKYRFCNVRREDDAVTRWIADNLRSRYGDSKHFWFMTVVARLFNNPETLDEIAVQRSLVLPTYKSGQMRKVLKARKAEGSRVFNPAYIVSTNGMKMDKIDYVIDVLLDPMWENRKATTNNLMTHADCLATVHQILEKQRGLGSFMAAQVVADIKYTPAFRGAGDWHSFAASGPGSRRGLNRLRGYDPKSPYPEKQWRADLEGLREVVLPMLPKHLQDLHAQDIQNCLCEFDKYERVRLGEGVPKQLYKEEGQ